MEVPPSRAGHRWGLAILGGVIGFLIGIGIGWAVFIAILSAVMFEHSTSEPEPTTWAERAGGFVLALIGLACIVTGPWLGSYLALRKSGLAHRKRTATIATVLVLLLALTVIATIVTVQILSTLDQQLLDTLPPTFRSALAR